MNFYKRIHIAYILYIYETLFSRDMNKSTYGTSLEIVGAHYFLTDNILHKRSTFLVILFPLS